MIAQDLEKRIERRVRHIVGQKAENMPCLFWWCRFASGETHPTKFSLLGPESAAEESTCSLTPDTILFLNGDIVYVTYTKMADNGSVISDGLGALKLASRPLPDSLPARLTIAPPQVARLSWHRNLTAWLYVPVGILIILLTCFGVNSLIGLSSISFPASVALLVALFFALLACDLVMGDRWTRGLVNVIDVPVCPIIVNFRSSLRIFLT
jgi:hypothetical protein